MKMYVRIEGDDTADGADYSIACSGWFLQNVIVELFKTLYRFCHGNIQPLITVIEEQTKFLEEVTKDV